MFLPRHGRSYDPDTDACDVQFGSVLIQPDDKKSLRPVGYWSRILYDTEGNHDTTEGECLTIVWSVVLLQPYFQVDKLLIHKKHANLSTVLYLTTDTGSLARWQLRLLKYKVEVMHHLCIVH